MSDFRSQESGSTNARAFTMVKRADGSPITTGTVNWYLKNISGANAGKWWRDSDQTWQVAETANAMTHQADGHWTRTLAASPWANGDVSLEYAKESGDLHVPISRMLKVEYTPQAQSDRNVLLAAAGSVALTEGYPTLGSTGTIAQLLYALLQHLEESSISGTTKTVKKRDQATTAETLTLNSSTTPTSITRAT